MIRVEGLGVKLGEVYGVHRRFYWIRFILNL